MVHDGVQTDAEVIGTDGVTGVLSERLDRVASLLTDLTTTLAAEHERAAARERVIDRLHEENQRMRAGERQLLLGPLLTDLQRLRNELLRQGGEITEALPPDRAAGLFASFAFTVEQALERNGVLPVRPDDGERFDPGRHRAARIVPTEDPDEDGTIADVIEEGYHDMVADRTVRPAAVIVRRQDPPDRGGQHHG